MIEDLRTRVEQQEVEIDTLSYDVDELRSELKKLRSELKQMMQLADHLQHLMAGKKMYDHAQDIGSAQKWNKAKRDSAWDLQSRARSERPAVDVSPTSPSLLNSQAETMRESCRQLGLDPQEIVRDDITY